MTEEDRFAFWTYGDFLGIMYLRDQKGWHIGIIFNNPTEGKKVWEKELESLNEKSLTMSFMDDASEYKFLLYSLPLMPLPKYNFSLYRSFDISNTYQKFKKESDGKAFLQFAIMGNSGIPTLTEKSKLITNIKFIKLSEVSHNSPEWIALEAQKLAHAKT